MTTTRLSLVRLALAACLALTSSGCAGALANAGGFHHCTRRDDTARCWGFNIYGQLGDGTTERRTRPVAVSGVSEVIEVAIGANHSCALRSNGTVECWGYLGDSAQMEPVPLPGLSNGRHIAAADGATCVLTDENSVLCYGPGHDALQELSFLSGATQISMAHNRRANIGCARMDEGTARCWRAGNPPAQLAVPELTGVTQVATNQEEACALLEDGTVTCWAHPTEPGSEPATNRVEGLESVAEIAMGGAHTCARVSDGTVSCWGFNASGQVGIDGDEHYEVEAPVTVNGLSQATRLELGGRHSCAWRSDGTLHCWGANHMGQLGDGSTQDRHRPSAVAFE